MKENKHIDTSSKEINYCLEMINSLYDTDFQEFKYLYNVQDLDSANNPLDRIMIVLDIFENLIDVNTYGEFTQASVNRIVSQFVNINKLSVSNDKKYSYSVKECIKQIRNYINFINAGKLQPSVVSAILEELVGNLSGGNEDVHAKLNDNIKSIKEEKLNKNFVLSQGFAQEGEDLILKRLFPADKKGFFVDIGAHHPTRFSNTYLFYRKGWRGITIDPLPGSSELFADMRPEDIHLQVAIGSGEESDQKAEYLMFKEAAYNCILIDGDEQPNMQASEIIDRIPVVVKSLDSILKENADAFEQIDLLSVDVEGYEEEIFSGFSLEEYLPKVVVIEIRGFDIESGYEHPLYKRLIANGYKLRSFLYHSLIFVQTPRSSIC